MKNQGQFPSFGSSFSALHDMLLIILGRRVRKISSFILSLLYIEAGCITWHKCFIFLWRGVTKRGKTHTCFTWNINPALHLLVSFFQHSFVLYVSNAHEYRYVNRLDDRIHYSFRVSSSQGRNSKNLPIYLYESDEFCIYIKTLKNSNTYSRNHFLSSNLHLC